MVFGLSKPSRSYASQSEGIWDPATGFARLAAPSSPSVDRSGTIRGSPGGRASRVTVERTTSWRGEQSDLERERDGAASGGRRRERAGTGSTIRPTAHTSTNDSPSARSTKSTRVSFNNKPTPSSASASQSITTRSTHKPPISKRERQRRTQDLQSEFDNFSVMDLAPPPTRSRLNVSNVDGDDEEDVIPSGSSSRVSDSLINVPSEGERRKSIKASKARSKTASSRSGNPADQDHVDEDGASTGYGITEGSEFGDGDQETLGRKGTAKRSGGTIKSKSKSQPQSQTKAKPKTKSKSDAGASTQTQTPTQVDYYQASKSVGITSPPPPPTSQPSYALDPGMHMNEIIHGQINPPMQMQGPPRRRISTMMPALLGGPSAGPGGGNEGMRYGGPYMQQGLGQQYDGQQQQQQQQQGYGQQDYGREMMYGQHQQQQQQQPYYEDPRQQQQQEQHQQQQPQYRPNFPSAIYNPQGELTPPSSEYHDLPQHHIRPTSPSPNAGHSLSYGPSSPWHVMVRPNGSETMPSRKYARSGLQSSAANEGEENGRAYEDDEDEEERDRDGDGDGRTASGSSSLLGTGTGTGSSLDGRREVGPNYPSPRKEMLQARERERQDAMQRLQGETLGDLQARRQEPLSVRTGEDRRVTESQPQSQSQSQSYGSRSDSPLRMVHPVPMETIFSEESRSGEQAQTPNNAPPASGMMPFLGAVVGTAVTPVLTRDVPSVQIVEIPARLQEGMSMVTPPLTAPNGGEQGQGQGQDALAPPTFSVQPPTPQREIEEPQMEVESRSPLNGPAVEEQGQPADQKERAIGSTEVARPPVVSMGPPAPPMAKAPEYNTARTISQPSSAETSQESSPRSSSNPAFSFARGVKSSRSTPSMPPAPTDPDATAFLKWDPRAQRWLPVPAGGLQAPPPARSHRAESVASSVSAYSQASGPALALGQPVYTSSRTRRQSLPHLSMGMAPPRQPRRQPSPGTSMFNSRPTSPAPSDGGYSRAPSSPTAAPGFPVRRMSIEPAYRMEASTLTLLPELREDGTLALNPPSSRPQSRMGSIQDFRDDVQSRTLSQHGSSQNLGFSRNSRSVVSSPATSENGDDAIPEDQAVDYSRPKSRQGSLYAASQYGGSQFGDNAGPRRAGSVAGREPGLATMSVRSDAVPLYQSDGGDTSGGGYTSLVLPTGSYKPTVDPTKDLNKIDPRVLGMPHATMSTITLTSTAGRPSRRNSMTSLFRAQQSPTPAHLLDDLPAPVTFSSTVPPPTKISNSQVLVQVYAVALDRFDAEMVRDKAASGAGSGKWIPGRAFFGRALEVGGEVRAIIKGDLVIGLVDIKKSGMLAEYVTCDRRRIARVPMGITLSQEEITCLPLLGVMAHRACIAVARGSRAFIMNAHEGIGSLVCQELAANGVLVTAHVPMDVDSAEDDAWDNGAREVLVGDPIALINTQHESGFDYILDTVGGRKIYDASRRIMRTQGRFVTLFGDDSAHTTSTPQLKTSLHALRRAFIKKDKKAINYVHLLPGGGDVDLSGQDTRDILELPIMAEYRPKVGMVLPFERAPEAFEELMGLFGLGEDGKGQGQGRGKEVVGEIVVRLNN